MLKSINLNKLIAIGLLSFFAFIIMSSGVVHAVTCGFGTKLSADGNSCISTSGTGGGNNNVPDIQTQANFTKETLSTTIVSIINYIIGIVAIIAVVMIVWAGYLYITAGMDEKNVEKAKKMLLYGVIGVVVVILSYSIVNFANSFLNP